MRKVILAILMAMIFVIPAFAAAEPAKEEPVKVTEETVLRELEKQAVVDTSSFLIVMGEMRKSPILLAAAAEILEMDQTELPTAEGEKINAASLYEKAIAEAKTLGNDDLANVLTKQSKLGASRAWNFGWFVDWADGCQKYGWYYTPGRFGHVRPSRYAPTGYN
jgi:hypothetical protein